MWGQEISMDEESTWRPTRHQVDNVSWATINYIRPTKKRSVKCKNKDRDKQLNCHWLL